MPSAPERVSAYSEKTGYMTFDWKKSEGADQYLIQVASDKKFTSIFKSNSTSDTTKSTAWFSEGNTYYWRVQASNLAGSSNWSDVGYFTLLYAPTNLALQNNTPNEITLTWKDNSTIEDGYIIERKQGTEASFTVIDTLKGSGNEYIDDNAGQSITYTYRVKAYKDSVVSSYSNEVSLTLTGIEGQKKIPTEYSLSQNYPNPFNPTTKIKFALPKSGLTKIVIYDLLGRAVRTLIDKEIEAGYHEITLDATDLTSGIYFYRVQSGDFIQTKKMILLK